MGIVDLYIRQLQGTECSEDKAEAFGRLFDASSKRLSEMFGMEQETYLYMRFAGFRRMRQRDFVNQGLGKENCYFQEEDEQQRNAGEQADPDAEGEKKREVVDEAAVKLRQDIEKWEKTVDAFMSGKLDRRRTVTILNNTPLVLCLLGADKDKRVMTNYSKLVKILKEKHCLDEKVLKQVPEAMADPVMIFKSATQGGDYVMMLDLKDERGATIVVPISLEYDMGRGYVANYVPSVYAKKDMESGNPRDVWFVNQVKDGNLLYRNNEKSRQWASSSRLQLPWVGTHLNGKKIIFTDDDLVNFKNENRGYYQGGKTDDGFKGAMFPLLDGRRMVALFENYDTSTILHETAHFWLEELRDAQYFSSCPAWARDLWAGLEEAYDFKREAVTPSRWTEIQESFAVNFEDYCKNGKAPVQSLQPVFDKFREWLSDIYEHVLEIAGQEKIRAATRRVFDVILGGDKDEPEKPAYTPMRM